MPREHERAPRQAAAWFARRPQAVPEDLRDVAELLLEVAGGRSGAFSHVVHELAHACRFASAAAAINSMIREHNRRQALGDRNVSALGAKAEAFRRNFADRASWEWLACL